MAASTEATAPRDPADRRPAQPPSRAPEGDAGIDDLEAEVAELRGLVADLEKRLADETLGVAAQWNDQVPEHLAPAGFERQIRKAAAGCDAGGDLVDVDCREPPCFAVFRVRSKDWWDRFVNQCPEWVDVYGRSTTMSQESVDCGDGRSERIVLLGPVGVWDYVDEPRPDDPWNATKRMSTRTEDAAASWTCLPPG